MIVRVLVSRSVLLNAAAVGMLIGISILRFEVADPGIMLLAVVPIALLGVMHGVRGGLFGASVASGVLLVWAFTQGHPSAVEEIDEPGVFFMLGLVTGIYAHGALGDCDPRHALQRAELRRAMQLGEVVFHYQPLADARTGRVVGLEALARWEHPDRGRIEPETFIPLAERDERTIWELTLLAVDRSLGDLFAWGEVASEVTIFINLSSVSLGQRDLAAAFSHILEKHRFPPSRLAVELTETALVGLPERAAQALVALKQLGMTIVLDDFGEGYSSITRLGRLPFDTLKVDLSLIGLPSASDAKRILRAMIQLAHSLGLQIVAERVEDDEIRDELTWLGCDLLQGFLLCPPLPADEVPDYLRHPSRSVAGLA
jgi:EAL domain-containing protein (putative c-di-GMP-specific phosphodiesterase class I)